MYKSAYGYDKETVFYFDELGNKYVVQGGSFSWRMNNPGLVKSHSHVARKNGAIGSYEGYAIFSDPKQGRKALLELLHAKKYFNSNLNTVAELYAARNKPNFLDELCKWYSFDRVKKLSKFSDEEFAGLLFALEKICGYKKIGNERFELLPKILFHIENASSNEDSYLIAGDILINKVEAIEKISTHYLDGVIVHLVNGQTYIRSRASYAMKSIHILKKRGFSDQDERFVRVIGTYKKGQVVWGFINGIWNIKEEALQSAQLISKMANDAQVFSMPNDTLGKGTDWGVWMKLKMNVDTPVIKNAIIFFRHLIDVALKEDREVPIVVFAHSMGAIIAEHALEHLSYDERMRLRIFTLGGASFIQPGKCHPESHNFACGKDIIVLLGSPVLRTLALKKHFSLKAGLDEKQMIENWVDEDTEFYLDSKQDEVIRNFQEQKRKWYQDHLDILRNVTILDGNYDHLLSSLHYQDVLKMVIGRYQLLEQRELSCLLEQH
jgi:hypothetical protein